MSPARTIQPMSPLVVAPLSNFHLPSVFRARLCFMFLALSVTRLSFYQFRKMTKMFARSRVIRFLSRRISIPRDFRIFLVILAYSRS